MTEEIEKFIEEKLTMSLEGLSVDDLRSKLEEGRNSINKSNSELQQADLTSDEGLDKFSEAGVQMNMNLLEIGVIGYRLVEMLNEILEEGRSHDEIAEQ